MTIKNTTSITKADVKSAMYAANFDNKQYKMRKVAFNMGGLLFGMLFVRSLLPEMLYGTGNYFLIIACGLICGALLLIGMYGMDINNYKYFSNIYSKMIGKTYTYEIDSEEINVVGKNGDQKCVLWKDIEKWNEDGDNFYLFLNKEESLILKKSGFTECTAKDLKELATAIMGMRENDVKEAE